MAEPPAPGPRESADPDIAFDRAWARESIARAMERLRAESEARGKVELFAALKGSLTGDEPARRETAARLGMSEGAVKIAVHRLRQRDGQLLRAEIADTVANPADVDVELRHLVAALRTNESRAREPHVKAVTGRPRSFRKW